MARSQANTTRTATVNLLKALLVTAPDDLRQTLRGLPTAAQARRCLTLRVGATQPLSEQTLRRELRRLARHIRGLDIELRDNQQQLHHLVAQMILYGVKTRCMTLTRHFTASTRRLAGTR